MVFNFSLLLLYIILSMVFAIALNKTLLKQNNNKAFRWFAKQSEDLLPMLLVVFVLRAFVAEPYKIPSGSMMPGLQNGDYILVSKYAYGLRNPITNSTLFSINKPKRGDPIVFYPPGGSQPFIKRVIGLGGDRVQLLPDGSVVINDKKIPKFYSSSTKQRYGYDTKLANIYNIQVGGREFLIQESVEKFNPLSQYGKYVVPKNHYFVMGDNRDHSADSRSCFGNRHCNQPPSRHNPFPNGWSAVPDNHIIGKAVYRWMFWQDWLSVPSFSNNGDIY